MSDDMTFEQAHGIVLSLCGQYQALSRLKEVLEVAAKADQVESALKKRRSALEADAERAEHARDAAVAQSKEAVRQADVEMSRQLEAMRRDHDREMAALRGEIAMMESRAADLRKELSVMEADIALKRRAYADETENLIAQRDSAKSSLNQIKSQLAALARA